jgi:hypothetical protein
MKEVKFDIRNQRHSIIPIVGDELYSFPYKEYGTKGVGKFRQSMINMDQYIDHSMDDELHIECCLGLASIEDYQMSMAYGSFPPEERARFAGNDSWTEMLRELEKYDPTGTHRTVIDNIFATNPKELAIRIVHRYMNFALGAIIPWFYGIVLKRDIAIFRNNIDAATAASQAEWEPAAALFPKLIKYIDTLPFKEVSRVLFFATYPNGGVVTHRDSVLAQHQDHNINLFFSSGPRPSFIWDEIKKTKTHLDPSARSYFFNNRDYHGVEPEPVFRYTLRVDGTFTDELCEKLGLEDGYTWKWDYEKYPKPEQIANTSE